MLWTFLRIPFSQKLLGTPSALFSRVFSRNLGKAHTFYTPSSNAVFFFRRFSSIAPNKNQDGPLQRARAWSLCTTMHTAKRQTYLLL